MSKKKKKNVRKTIIQQDEEHTEHFRSYGDESMECKQHTLVQFRIINTITMFYIANCASILNLSYCLCLLSIKFCLLN